MLIAMHDGPATAYAIDSLQDRGKFFIEPGEVVYKGQIVGEYNKGQIFPKNDSNDVVFRLRKEDQKKVKDNQLIKAKITKYGRSYIKECSLVEVLGNVDDKGIEIKEVIH